jgi:beta-lactam-binding protein with PASTA domain
MSLRNFFYNLKEYLISKYFWNTVIALGVFVFLVIFASSTYLKIYTRHGQSILTPEFRGLHLEQAAEIAYQKHINLVIIDSIYEGIGEPGTIVDQTPPANFHIKKGRSVFITIKAFSPKMITVPNLTQISLTQANYDLQRVGLDLGNIIYQPSANFDNLVIAMLYKGDTLRPGTRLPMGTKIDLVVAKRVFDTLSAVAPDTLDDNSQEQQVQIFDY